MFQGIEPYEQYKLFGQMWNNIEYQETMYQHHESTYWNFKLLYIAWYADISNHIAHNGCRGVKGIDTAQLSSAEPHPRFCTSSNNVCNVSDVCNSKNLSQWFWLRIRLHVFPRHLVSTSSFEFLYKKKKKKSGFYRPLQLLLMLKFAREFRLVMMFLFPAESIMSSRMH